MAKPRTFYASRAKEARRMAAGVRELARTKSLDLLEMAGAFDQGEAGATIVGKGCIRAARLRARIAKEVRRPK